MGYTISGCQAEINRLNELINQATGQRDKINNIIQEIENAKEYVEEINTNVSKYFSVNEKEFKKDMLDTLKNQINAALNNMKGMPGQISNYVNKTNTRINELKRIKRDLEEKKRKKEEEERKKKQQEQQGS